MPVILPVARRGRGPGRPRRAHPAPARPRCDVARVELRGAPSVPCRTRVTLRTQRLHEPTSKPAGLPGDPRPRTTSRTPAPEAARARAPRRRLALNDDARAARAGRHQRVRRVRPNIASLHRTDAHDPRPPTAPAHGLSHAPAAARGRPGRTRDGATSRAPVSSMRPAACGFRRVSPREPPAVALNGVRSTGTAGSDGASGGPREKA